MLTDFKGYPQWSPTILEIIGECCEGERITARIVGLGGRSVKCHPILDRVIENQLLAWTVSFAHRSILTGFHEFALREVLSGTELVHSDTFDGLLSTPLRPLLAANRRFMARQNDALTGRVSNW